MATTTGIESMPDKQTISSTKLAAYAQALRDRYPPKNKILLIQTIQFQLEAFNPEIARNKGYYAYPPAGLQCLAKSLAGRDIDVQILDLNFEFLKRINRDPEFDPLDWLTIVDEWLERVQPYLVGVTNIGVSSNLFKANHPLTGVLRHVQAKDQFVVVAGGPVATNGYEECLEHDFCHFVIMGEGENKFKFLLDQLLGRSTGQIPTPGIHFKFNNEMVQTQGLPDIVKLSGPMIAPYELVPIEEYNQVGSLNPFSRMIGQDRPFTGIQLNRGCRAQCKFCGVPSFMGPGVRAYPFQDIIEELVYLVEKRGIRHFELLDDDFFGPSSLRENVTELLSYMARLHDRYGTTWAAGNGLIAGSITEEIARLIQASGCVGFRIGVESGNPEMLKRMRKPATIKTLREFALTVRGYPDVFVGANYIIGSFGDETFGQMMDTYRFSCELDVDWAGFSVFQFTSKKTVEKEKLNHDGKPASEFNPSKDSASRELRTQEGLRRGLSVFEIADDEIPSRDQIKEIWFVFNLLSNYVNNRNLRPGGNPEKLARWLEACRVTYPQNAYMALFAGLCYVLLGEQEKVNSRSEQTRQLLDSSEYWRYRFDQFKLTDLAHEWPKTSEDVYNKLNNLRALCEIRQEHLLS